jgi:hypothetical protein
MPAQSSYSRPVWKDFCFFLAAYAYWQLRDNVWGGKLIGVTLCYAIVAGEGMLREVQANGAFRRSH